MRENDWTKVLGWPGYKVYQHEINEPAKTAASFMTSFTSCSMPPPRWMKCGAAEFFRKGGAAREVVKGKRWLLLSRSVHLNPDKKRQLHELFALNRRVMKAYLLKESLDRLEAVNGNIKALLRRGRGYRDLNYLLLKAQRLAATKTQFIVLQKAA
jgi:hypothetical protein